MKILYVYGSMAPFTRADLDTLRSAHEVRELHFRRGPRHVLQSSLAAVKGALWADAVVAWFGSIHALVPFLAGRLFGRHCIVIAGGYDSACEPEIDYGNMRPGARRWIGRLVFRLATRILAFSELASREVVANTGADPKKVQVLVLGLADVANGQQPMPAAERRGVLTVSIVNESNLSRKGLLTFVEAARQLPDVPFTLVGEWTDSAAERLKAAAPPNLTLTGWVSDEELNARMRSAAVYVQGSFHEAFGFALAEAMLWGCVPVTTSRGSLPEVVGDAGFVVPYGDADATAGAIRTALATPAKGEAARTRILTHFPRQLRHRKLLAIMQELEGARATR